MDESQVNDLLTLIGAVVTLGAAFAKLFGPKQTQVVGWVIDAFQVKSRWRGLVNLAVGMTIAGALSAYAAWQADNWGMMVAGILAGFMASEEAAKTHDEQVRQEGAQTGQAAPKVQV